MLMGMLGMLPGQRKHVADVVDFSCQEGVISIHTICCISMHVVVIGELHYMCKT